MSTDSTEESDSPVTIPQTEINISNTSTNSQIVLNDLLLMELLCRHPFLFNRNYDKDYVSWGWEQLTKTFNQSYEAVELVAPFSVTDLQSRWDILRPLIGGLAKAKGQIPDPLWRVVVNVHIAMQLRKIPDGPKTKCQDFLLSQLPYLQSLSEVQRKRLEVEVLDLILDQERLEKATHKLGPKEQKAAQSEYDEFLKAIRVKELPADTLERLAADGFCIGRQTKSEIANGHQKDRVISDVCTTQNVINGSKDDEIKTEPTNESTNSDGIKADEKLYGKPRFVPLKSAKYYVQNFRVRMKKMDLDDHLPLARIRRSNRAR
ncbi:uncharacterized protein LOC108093870 [Drosophila ficusphila]|uniref:uncharacterized protein LOC108093870 n=1 Tax=Drosophila ficusphila TaxID=30025 RepID=UPI0007E662CA|nr:uncharacterized protein LOC108093870 [Drosophila ficusphila]